MKKHPEKQISLRIPVGAPVLTDPCRAIILLNGIPDEVWKETFYKYWDKNNLESVALRFEEKNIVIEDLVKDKPFSEEPFPEEKILEIIDQTIVQTNQELWDYNRKVVEEMTERYSAY